MTATIQRAFKFHAFPPVAGVEDFELAAALKQKLWSQLVTIHDEYLVRLSRLKPNMKGWSKDECEAFYKSEAYQALAGWRRDETRRACNRITDEGLNWPDRQKTVRMFRGAVAGAAKTGAKPLAETRFRSDWCEMFFQDGVRPSRLFGSNGNQASVMMLPPNEREKRRAPSSQGSRLRRAQLMINLRGPRHPKGRAQLNIDFVMYRPIPPDALVNEIRVFRYMQTSLNREGRRRCRWQWYVAFTLTQQTAVNTSRRACAVEFEWAATHSEDQLQPFCRVYDGTQTVLHVMPYGHVEDWRAAKAMKDETRLITNPDEREAREIEYNARLRRLEGRRMHEIRNFAAEIARVHGAVAVQKMDLSIKGAKNYTAPSLLRMALKNAVAAAGGVFIEVKGSKKEEGFRKKMYKEAVFALGNETNVAELQTVA